MQRLCSRPLRATSGLDASRSRKAHVTRHQSVLKFVALALGVQVQLSRADQSRADQRNETGPILATCLAHVLTASKELFYDTIHVEASKQLRRWFYLCAWLFNDLTDCA